MRLLFIVLLIVSSTAIFAQDTLPNFTAIKKKDGTVNISWINDYGIVKQLTIQRSTNPKNNFVSIATDSLPMNRKGNYEDKNNRTRLTNFYYRIYIQLPEGKYLYTPVQKASKDGLGPVTEKYIKPFGKGVKSIDIINNWLFAKYTPKPKPFSILTNPESSEEGNIAVDNNKPWEPSDYIFADKKGNILVVLPNAETRNFSIDFFDENEKKILFIKKIQESNLILERYNFYKSGWYSFEIKENGSLFEKQKFFVPPLIVAPINSRNK